MNDSVRLIDLLISGVKAARHARRWTQEDTAAAFRRHGLKAWRKSTVGQMEAGLRFPPLRELLIMCAALNVPLNELIAPSRGDVLIDDGVTMPGGAIRAVLSGIAAWIAEVPANPERPTDPEFDAARRFAVPATVIAATARSLWGRSLEEERDARAGDLSSSSPRSRQARRGLAARPLYAELEKTLRAQGLIGP